MNTRRIEERNMRDAEEKLIAHILLFFLLVLYISMFLAVIVIVAGALSPKSIW